MENYKMVEVNKRLPKMANHKIETLLWLLELREDVKCKSIDDLKFKMLNSDVLIDVVYRVLFFDAYKKLWKRKKEEIKDVRKIEEKRIIEGYNQMMEKNKNTFRMYNLITSKA